MSGLINDVFGAGGSAKTDRSNQLTSFSDLKNTFNWALPFGQQAASAGQAATQGGLQDLGQAGGYYSKLLSGNRSTLQQAVAPETAAVQAGADASRRQLAASGTARGGGVAGTNQTQQNDTMAKIDQALFGVRPAAAEGLSKVGTAEGNIGLGETQTGVEAAGLGEKAAGTLGELSGGARATDFGINQKLVGQDIGMLGDVFGAFGFGGINDAISNISENV